MSPVFQNRNVPFWRRGDTSGFGEGLAIGAPGMIGAWLSGQMFGRDDFRLLGLLVVNGVGQSFAIIQDQNVFLSIHTDCDLCVAQGIGGAVGLDLVNDLLKLEREVFGQAAGLLPGENVGEIVFGGEGTMGIDRASGFDCKASVEIGEELGQIGVAVRHAGNAS